MEKNNYLNNNINPKYNNYLNMRQYAQGGNLTRFDEGGTHESSPLGGIPQGVAPDGKQNTVEQGESKKGNFIYSNRIALDKGLVKQFNLPSYVANKSVSDASKAIDDKFKHRADKYAQETKNTLLDRLSQAQEYLKQQEQSQLEQTNQSMQANSQQVPDMMNGQVPEGMEEYSQQESQQGQEMQDPQNIQTPSPIAAFGGYQQHRYSGLDNPNSEMNVAPPVTGAAGTAGPGAGAVIGAAGAAMDLGQLAFGKAAQDTSGLAASGRVGGAGMIGGSALKGAAAGAGFGPLGAAIGGGVGLLAGIAGLGKARAAETKNTTNFALNTNSQFQDQHAYGGVLGGDEPIKATKSEIANNPVIPSARTGDATSRYVNITGYQPGVVSGSKGVRGSYIYSPELSGGREFVSNSGLVDLHSSPQWNTYQNNMKAQIAAEQAAGLPVSSYSNLNKKFAYGGNMNQYVKGGPAKVASVNELKPAEFADLKNAADINNLKFNTSNIKVASKTPVPTLYQKAKIGLKDTGEYLSENLGDIARLAPVAMNAYQLKNLQKPTGFQYETLANRYKPQYVDEAQMQRIVDQEGNNTMSAIGQMGGSEGATRNAILAMGLNKTKGLSDAYANAAAQNRAQDAQAQQFNLGVDAQNVATRNRAIDEMRADKGAYDSAKSKFLSSMGTDIGDIGKEKNASDAAIAMFGYTRKGKYVVDKQGNIVSPETLAKRQADFSTYISEQNKKDNK